MCSVSVSLSCWGQGRVDADGNIEEVKHWIDEAENPSCQQEHSFFLFIDVILFAFYIASEIPPLQKSHSSSHQEQDSTKCVEYPYL